MEIQLNDEQREVCRQAVLVFGKDAQALKAAEELRELADSVEAWARHENGSYTGLVDERADVAIMLHQLDNMLLISPMYFRGAVEAHIPTKIEKLKGHMQDYLEGRAPQAGVRQQAEQPERVEDEHIPGAGFGEEDKGPLHPVESCTYRMKCLACGHEWECGSGAISGCPKDSCGGFGAALRVDVTMKRDDPYASLRTVLDSAFEQAAGGKGAERHANGLPFEDQPIMQITRLLGEHPVAALAYQVVKKTVEAGRLYRIKGPDAAVREMQGAINYAAATILRLQELGKEQSK